ncbi:hypothetical protein E2493_02020 [Sphingomonas parva]|uniref:DUF1570 domain-containing protein n=1 Tax=Sphingomonas parva TaxID=2555898 RepID=A0A4Y8ZZ80_9SPHN|nr:hypothetical protein [Sphingomonas parva]TFI60046.1 hypothetical protein E2493_02020 [Sphingomonas parva]
MSRNALLFPMLLAAFGSWSAQAAPRPAPTDDDIVVTADRVAKRSRWLKVETAHFVLYGIDTEKALVVRATELERFDSLLRTLTRVPNNEPGVLERLPVYLVRGRPSLNRLRRQYYPPRFYPTGYYSAAPSGVLLAVDVLLDESVRTRDDSRVSLFTEYARHFLLQHSRGNYLPAWYVDGFAFYMSATKFSGGRVEYGRAHESLARALVSEPWEPMERIISGRLNHGWMYSAQSLLLVHYIFARDERVAAFMRFLEAARGGARPVEAFTAAFDMDMDGLRAALKRHMTRATYVRAETPAAPSADALVATLPPSADQLLLDQAALRIGVPQRDRLDGMLSRARSVAAERRDGFSQRVLLHAAIDAGAPDADDKALDALIAASPADPELVYLKGMRHLTAGRDDPASRPAHYREARRWFARAYTLDPAYYPAMYRYAESLATEPSFISASTENILLGAVELAPQATQIRVTAALMLMLNDQPEQAARLLEAMPVSGRDPLSASIPSLLELARGGGRPSHQALLGSFREQALWRDLNCC